MPTPRDHLAVSVVAGKINVIGGRLGSYDRNLEANEVYDPSMDSWSTQAPLPTVRSGIASATVDHKVFVLGGESTQRAFYENESYDPLLDTWETMPQLPTARHGLGAVAIGNRIYVLAGGPTPGGSASSRNELFIVLNPAKR